MSKDLQDGKELPEEEPWVEPVPDPWGGRNPSATVSFLVHDADGQILRTGYCALRDLKGQGGEGQTVMEGQANDRFQKIVAGKVADKTAQEIAAKERPVIPPEKQRAEITQEQWDQALARLSEIEQRLSKIEPK